MSAAGASAGVAGARVERLEVGGVGIEVLRGGGGEAVLLLHDIEYLNAWQPFHRRMAEGFELLAPSHPGFGASELPDGFDSVDDIAYLYLDLLRDVGPAHVVGMGFGGWVAAEMAVRDTRDMRRLVLVDAVGIKVSGREVADIADTFVVDPKTLLEMTWHDASAGESAMKLPGLGALTEDELRTLLRNRQSAALFGWNPFMHDPKLRGRLRRVDVPALVLWGDDDRVVSPDYGRAFAEAIPGARFETVARAGHYPYLEQPDACARAVAAFLRE